MDQEEQQQREKEQKNATLNKESPVWFPKKKNSLFSDKKKPTYSPPPLIDLACLFLPVAKCEYIISQSEQKQKQKKDC